MTITGYTFPITTTEDGSLSLSSDATYIEEQIRTCLLTYRGERLGVPRLGSILYPISAYGDASSIRADIQQMLDEFIPGVRKAVSVRIDDVNGVFEVDVRFVFDSEENFTSVVL